MLSTAGSAYWGSLAGSSTCEGSLMLYDYTNFGMLNFLFKSKTEEIKKTMPFLDFDKLTFQVFVLHIFHYFTLINLTFQVLFYMPFTFLTSILC